MVYRMYPTNTGPEYVSLEDVELNYNEDNKITTNEKLDESKIIENIIINIDQTYKLHDKIIDNSKQSKNSKSNYLYAVIGSVYDKLNLNNEQIFI